MSERVQFRILGPLEVVRGDERVALGGPRQRAVLARLLLDLGRPVSADALIDAVWNGRPPPSASKTLQKYVSELRKSLGRDVLRTTSSGYSAGVAPDDVDAACFERALGEARAAAQNGRFEQARQALATALAMWRGPLLADLPDAEFACTERERLADVHLSLVEERLNVELALGGHSEIVGALAELVEEHPERDQLCALLLLALYRSGRQIEALRAYERHRRWRAEELGLEPAEGLRRLEAAILRQDPALGTTTPVQVTVGDHAGNLPMSRTSFVGRDGDLSQVVAALAAPGLLTLVGPAGVGKTRLALEAATAALVRFPGGGWLVELAATSDPALVPRAVADTLGVPDQPGESLVDTIGAALRHRPATLMVLDNCEHVLAASASLVDRLLDRAGSATILATSRQRLGVTGERVHHVRPLPVPDVDGETTDAVRLFNARVRLAAPGIELGPDDDVSIGLICRQLDGLPLAIELAAAQVRVLEPTEIAARLGDRFRLLARPGAGPSRQRSLEAAVAWSYERLDSSARRVFDRLSVFAGSCTLEAAEAVCSGAGVARSDVLSLVSDLVDRSMLTRERGPASVARYRLLETLRLYGANHLCQAGDADHARRAHAMFMLRLANEARPNLPGPAELTWKTRLQAEEPNLRAALDWAAAHDRVLALRLAVAVWPYWSVRWLNREGVPYLESLLDHGAAEVPSELRAWALTAAASLSSDTGEARLAAAWAEEAIVRFRRLGDAVGLANAQLALASALSNQGTLERAERVAQEVLTAAAALDDRVIEGSALEIYGYAAARRGDHEEASRRHERELQVWLEVGSVVRQANAHRRLAHAARSLGDLDRAVVLSQRALDGFMARDDPTAVAHARSTLGDVARLRGDDDEAARIYHDALAEFLAAGDRRCTASTYKNLARLADRAGRHDEAAALYLDSLRLRQVLGDEAGLAECLEGLASGCLASGRVDGAVRLLAATARLRSVTGERPLPEDRGTAERVAAAARSRLGDVRFDTLWHEGAQLDADAAVECARSLWRVMA